jgi:hypothetical protein
MPLYNISSGAATTITTAAQTLLQIATPSTRRARLIEFVISFSSVTATDAPVLIQIMRQTTAGTSTAVTPSALDPAEPAALCSGNDLFTVEPSASTILRSFLVTPIGSTLLYQVPLGNEIVVPISGFLGFRATAPQGETSIWAYCTYLE